MIPLDAAAMTTALPPAPPAIPAQAHDEAFEALLQDLARWLQLPGLRLDSRGACAIRFDGRLHVTLQRNPREAEELWLHADLGPTRGEASQYQALLQGNLLWQATAGATLGLTHDDPPRALLATRLRWRGLERAILADTLEAFVGACDHWVAVLSVRPAQAAAPASTEAGVTFGLLA